MKKRICPVCGENANTGSRKRPHYEVVVVVKKLNLFLHNTCFLDLKLAVNGIWNRL